MRYIKLFESRELYKKLYDLKLAQRISEQEYYTRIEKIVKATNSDVDRLNEFFDSLGKLLGRPRASITSMSIKSGHVDKIRISVGHETWYIDILEDDYFLYKKYNRVKNDYYLIDGWDGLEVFLKQKLVE